MCGIAGAVGDKEHLGADLQAMSRSLAHRGPDSHGIYVDASQPVGFAHRRLAILDLTEAGHQPMVSRSGRFVLCYNGELYNFRELAARLGAGALASDTAVLLGAIERFGIRGALELCNGMFAFAVLDRQEAVVHLVRDRLGEKPLYFSTEPGGVLFASELRAIELASRHSLDVDPQAVEELLRYEFIGAGRTIYRGVEQLRPGHHLMLDAASGKRLSLEPYWEPPQPIAARATPASLDELDEALVASVQLRLRADVAVGSLLSGGVDSALITSIAAQHHAGLSTFTAGVADQQYDERAPARAVAAALGTKHHEIELTEGDLLELVVQLPDAYDEPFADSSALPTLALAKFVRSQVKVALTGDGGDELFAGYPRYRLAPKTWRVARRIPALLSSGRPASVLTQAAGQLERFSAHFPRPLRERSPQWVVSLLLAGNTTDSFLDHYRNVRSDTHDPASLLSVDWRTNGSRSTGYRFASGENALAAMMLDDLQNYLPDDILVKVDRAAMSVALETRLPLLDPAVVDVAWRMPTDEVVGSKQALRSLLSRHLPGVDISKEKRGFGVPVAKWLRGPLRNWGNELLSPAALREVGFLDVAAITAMWQRHQAGVNEQQPLWAVLMLQAWALQAPGRRIGE